MQETILIPLIRCDPIDHVVPFVGSIAKPGMKVVFLVRSRAGDWERMNAHLTAIHTGIVIPLQTCGARELARSEREKQAAEAKLAAVCQSLRRNGLETEVKIYAGGLKKTLAKLAKNENVRFVMIPGGGGSLFARLVGPIVRFFNPVKGAGFSPLVLIQPEHGTARSK